MNCQPYTNIGSLLGSIEAKNEALLERLKRLYPCVEDVTKLPQAWSNEAKATPLGLTCDKLGCYFRGSGRRDEDEKYAASVRTDHFIPPSCLIYYFEITFISKGREGYMGVGLTSTLPPLTKLPGWCQGSYGYHADDGETFNGDGRGHPFGPTFTTGDVIGCGYNLVEGRCFFTKNGLNLGCAFDDMPTNILYYPTIGLKTPGEEIRANFGQQDFVYDIEQDLRSLRKNMTHAMTNYSIADFGDWQSTLHKLVQSWLLQNSYPNTAEAFTKSAKIECKENTQRIRQRNRIQQLVLNGKISEAIKLTNCLCPNLLQNNPNLLFTLRCRQFVELISGADNDYHSSLNSFDADISNEPNGAHKMDVRGDQPSGSDKMLDTLIDPELDQNEQKFVRLIEFGQDLSNDLQKLNKLYGKNEANEKMLQEAVGLIAFMNPKNSGCGKLLDPKEREPISQLLNSSIVRSEMGHSYKLPLEEIVNHLRKLIRLNDSHGRWLVDRLF